MCSLNKLRFRKKELDLCVGEWVEVRSQQEILATLDDSGTLEALPFMPEMLQYCGKQFRVYKSAHKTCDTIKKSTNRGMTNVVHLDGLRCDGTAHGGCQARCLLFWKTAWLTRVDGSQPKGYPVQTPRQSRNEIEIAKTQCDLASLIRATRVPLIKGEHAEELYRCQATDLLQATTALQWWDWRYYMKDLTSRNVPLGDFIRYVMLATFNFVMRLPSTINQTAQRVLNYLTNPGQKSCVPQVADRPPETMPGFAVRSIKSFLSHYSLPRHFVRYIMIVALKLLEPLISRLHSYPYVRGLAKTKTPTAVLNLQPGELVQIRSLDDIEHTINKERRNRGLKIDPEMVRYCGGVYRVLARVEKIINEKNGKMIHLPNVCLILEGVTCSGCFSRNRLFCPRSIYSYWREIWLKRVDNPKHG
jgi:hypothetical protein